MRSTPYVAGRRAEYKCIEDLRRDGWRGRRTAGSHGPFDVIAWRDSRLLLIQVKKVAKHPQMAQAVARANTTWGDSGLLEMCWIELETWIRHRRYWYIFHYPHDTLERRTK